MDSTGHPAGTGWQRLTGDKAIPGVAGIYSHRTGTITVWHVVGAGKTGPGWRLTAIYPNGEVEQVIARTQWQARAKLKGES